MGKRRRGRRAGAVAALVALAGVASPSTSFADEAPTARLAFALPAELAGRCPDESVLRDLVAARLGRDGFSAEAEPALELAIREGDDELVGRVELRDGEGVLLGEQELRAPPERCDDLLAAAAMAMAIVLDPASGLLGESAAEGPRGGDTGGEATPSRPVVVLQMVDWEVPPGMAAGGEPPAEAAPADPPPAGPARLELWLRAAPSVALGRMPRAALGGHLGLAVARGRLELGLDLAAHLSPGSMRVGDVELRMFDASVTALPCLRVPWLSLCALASVALLEARTPGGDQRPARAAIPRVGTRLALRLPLGDRFELAPFAQVDVSFVQPSLRADGERIWTAPPAALVVGLDLRPRL